LIEQAIMHERRRLKGCATRRFQRSKLSSLRSAIGGRALIGLPNDSLLEGGSGPFH
jgi:hypothetical protein